jgi:hypothetical protein
MNKANQYPTHTSRTSDTYTVQQWIFGGEVLINNMLETKGKGNEACVAVGQLQQTRPESVLWIAEVGRLDTFKPHLLQRL